MPTEDLPSEIDVTAARDLLAAGHATLLDVREPFEHAICQVPASLLLPMREVPAALARLPRDRPLLVLCHHGSRSQRVTHYLRANGFTQAINIGGGIDAWAAELDPTLQRY